MNIAILGYGTIGKGVFEISKKNDDFNVVRIFDRIEKFDFNYIHLFTNNLDDILADESIDIVVEVLGGFNFAYDCIKKCLASGKSVVTANKEVIAIAIDELTVVAAKNNVSIYYEASVGGGIPIIKQITEIRRTSKINSICGILNGTTNYILTKMFNGMSFDEALKEAQNKGFAEADPTADLEGLDMIRKIAILSDLAWNTKIDINEIYHKGVNSIKDDDFKYAEDNGYKIKFICSSELIDNKINISVKPYFIKNNHPFANIENEFNAVMLNTTYNDKLLFIGKGAGSLPTAAAIFGDLYAIKNKYKFDEYSNINKFEIIKEEDNDNLLVLGE